MNKEEIKEIAKRNISEVLSDMESDDYNDDSAIRDFGGNSIDFAEIVMGVQEDLGLNIPLAELGKAKTLNELVNSCYDNMNKED